MKTLLQFRNIATALALILTAATGFAQNIDFLVHGRYTHPIHKEKLDMARNVGDIIPYYPASWINQYVSVEISAATDENTVMATGANEILTPEQLNILQTAGLGTEIVVNIQYRFLNEVTHQIEDRRINYSTTIVPETEAEFPGGNKELREYFQGNAIDKLSEESSASMQQTVVRFTVDEQGDIANTQIVQSSGDPEIDQMFLEAINNMPSWKPAEDTQGVAVRQDFQFSVGNNTGC